MARFQTIVDRLEFAIATGRIRPGERLASLREASERWGVHFHTVRRAYQELERLGLVEIQRGARAVVADRSASGSGEGLRALVEETLDTANRRFGATPLDVLQTIRSLEEQARAALTVVECSQTLGASLARQLRARWIVDAGNHRIGSGELPEGLLLSTYFHFREVRAATIARQEGAEFVRIAIAPWTLAGLRDAMRERGATRIVLCETDAALGRELADEVRASIGDPIELRIETPARAIDLLRHLAGDEVALVSPRQWDSLDPKARTPEGAVLIDYEVDATDLEQLGRRRLWDAARASSERQH